MGSGNKINLKNVLIITDSSFPYGGASANFLRLFSKGLLENNVNVKVLLQKGGAYSGGVNNTFVENISYSFSGFKVRPQNIFLKIIDSFCGIVYPFFYILLRTGKKFDLIFVYNSSTYGSILILIAGKIKRIKTCRIVVEWYEKYTIVKNKIRYLRWWDFILGMKYIVTKFDFIFVLTTFLRDYYVKRGVKSSRIILIPNFVDLNTFQCEAPKPLSPNNKFIIGYCGSPNRKDGILDLFEAFRLFSLNINDAHLVIIGDLPGKDTLLPGLKNVVKKLELESKITFTGLVPFSEVPALLNSSTVLVLARPSGRFAEAGFPTKLGEYFACKKPVVITSVGDIPFYFKDEKELLIAQPDNPKSICEKLNKLYFNKMLASEVSENGFNWASEYLDFRKNAKRVIDFFERR